MLIMPQQLSMYFLRSISAYSKMSVSDRGVWMMSCKVTMLACFKSFRREISLMAVHGAPSSCSRRISFSATSLSVILHTIKYNMFNLSGSSCCCCCCCLGLSCGSTYCYPFIIMLISLCVSNDDNDGDRWRVFMNNS